MAAKGLLIPAKHYAIMPRKAFQDFANTLPPMLVGWRMADDLEQLAGLPDGRLTIDVLSGRASHSAAGDLKLHIACELQAWLVGRMAVMRIDATVLDSAVVTADIHTDRIATDRNRLIAFTFDAQATLVSDGKTYNGELSERHIWHNRLSEKSSQTHFRSESN